MGKGAIVRMCESCSAKACGSCSGDDCECYAVFKAWEDYRAASLTTIKPRRGGRRPPPVQPPAHHAYTGRHERNLAYVIDASGRRIKQRLSRRLSD